MTIQARGVTEQVDAFQDAFNGGLELAARIAESWADEAEAVAGPKSGEGYRNLAATIRRKQQ
jgi:hypothetical protein